MAPIGTGDMLGWFAPPEVGVISLVVFLVLSITLVALCIRCRRESGSGYDVNNKTTGGAGGNTDQGYVGWRNHNDMPANTLERPHAETH